MIGEPIVSIVIVNYNAGDLLRRCLERIDSQSLQSFEVIIVDNASKDDSLEGFQLSDRIRIIRNAENRGFAAAQNQGMQAARSGYLMPLNFDIALSETFLQEMVAAIESAPQIATVSCKLLRMGADFTPSQQIDNVGLLLPANRVPVHRGVAETDTGQYDQPVLVFGAMGAAALYRREAVEQAAYQGQFFDESYFMWYEEIDLDWRLRLMGWDCLYAPKAVAYHVGDVHGHGRSKFGAQISMRNRWRMIASNECPRCLLKNIPSILGEEIALFWYIATRGWIDVYIRALGSFLSSLPATLRKRSWVRRHARRSCLPKYPFPIPS
ncbi:MAG TPA: glycosyltransferase family 2 protein [Anaerolineales bacterium]|nr:glycosyltransferase family 2 protein [Anaerolineales bacterium]